MNIHLREIQDCPYKQVLVGYEVRNLNNYLEEKGLLKKFWNWFKGQQTIKLGKEDCVLKSDVKRFLRQYAK